MAWRGNPTAWHGKLEQRRDNMELDSASTKDKVADGTREMGCGHRGCRPEQFHVHDYQKKRERHAANMEASRAGDRRRGTCARHMEEAVCAQRELGAV